MHIATFVKQIPDPEAPSSLYEINRAQTRVIPAGSVPPDISDYDRYGVEGALMLKDREPDILISVVSLGKSHTIDVIKRPLAQGCDDLYLLQGDDLDDPDPVATAHGLVEAIRKIGGIDLATFGRQSGNLDQGTVGPGVAILLGWPCVTNAVNVEHRDGKLIVERLADGGTEVLEVTMPAVLTFSSEMPQQPRYATMRGIMRARQIDPVIWSSADLGINPAELERLEVLDVFFPQSTGQVEMIAAESPAESGRELARRLREARLI